MKGLDGSFQMAFDLYQAPMNLFQDLEVAVGMTPKVLRLREPSLLGLPRQLAQQFLWVVELLAAT